jgi:hypothetical protein
MINERIDALRKRERVCWDMSEVFLHARDAHGLHDMGVEIQGIQWALRELEAITEGQAREAERLRVEAQAQYDRGYYDGCTHPLEQST